MKLVAILLALAPLVGSVSAQEPAAREALRLEDLERRALENNPTIAQAAAATRAIEGHKRQAGAFPNFVIGYEGRDLTPYKDKFTIQTEHMFVVEQRVPLGHQLGRAQRALEEARAESEARAQAQRQRVLNAVRIVYYDVLAVERLVAVRRDLARLAREAVEVSEQLYNVGQADQPDLLEAESEAQRAELELRGADNKRASTRRMLAAVTGDAEVEQAPLVGDIEASLPDLDPEAALARLVRDSPALAAARARIRQAEAAVEVERARRMGDLNLRAGVGFNFDRAHGTGGWVGEFAFGIPIPLFDRRKGAIAAAQAEVEQATLEVQRLELALRARFSETLEAYATARQRAETFKTEILPRADKAYQLYLSRFREMAAAYPQVLIAQRSLFQARADLLEAQSAAWHASLSIGGFLLSGALAEPADMHAPAGMSGDMGMSNHE